jgi:pantothenate kinase-related protein Tda10
VRNKGDLTLKNIADAKIPVFEFSGEWRDAFGTPQRTGVWFIYGGSGHGKTSFVLMLIKELAKYGNILFVSYEEGNVSAALQEGIARLGLTEINKRVTVCTNNRKELIERLQKPKSHDIIIIDSLDVSEFKRIEQISALKDKFHNKLFVFTGWAKGMVPAKRIGEDALFLANQKIFVKNYRAFSRGRSFGTEEYFTIWEEGARNLNEFK